MRVLNLFIIPLSLTLATIAGSNSSKNKTNVASPAPGSLLSAKKQPVDRVLTHAGKRHLINYRSRGVNDEPIVASGYTLLPKGDAPKDGWPVLAWAHGTSGIADTCALSSVYPGGPEYDYQNLTLPVLDWWLEQGFAIVAPDYEGLGTPGQHTYMNANSQLHTVVDSVRAIRYLYEEDTISADWIVMGHSQGGAAAAVVAARAQHDADDLNLQGAIPIAPGGYKYASIVEYAAKTPNPDPGVAVFLPMVLLGAEAADPSLHADEVVSKDMKSALMSARSRCLSDLREQFTESPNRLFKEGTDLQPLLSYLDKQSIEKMTPTVPVLFIQGEADKIVNPNDTRAYYKSLREQGKTVHFETVANGSHRDALRKSPSLVKSFLDDIHLKN